MPVRLQKHSEKDFLFMNNKRLNGFKGYLNAMYLANKNHLYSCNKKQPPLFNSDCFLYGSAKAYLISSAFNPLFTFISLNVMSNFIIPRSFTIRVGMSTPLNGL